MNEPILAVLAAGIGSRYGGLKQVDGIDGRGHILIDYSIYDAVKAGFRCVVFVIRREMKNSFCELIKSRLWYKEIDVEFAFQDPHMLPSAFDMPKNRIKPWGTAHAIACLSGTVNSPFAVINADDFYGRSALAEIYEFLKRNESDRLYAAVGYKLENTLSKNGSVSRGVMSVEGGFLKKITETAGIRENGEKIISERGYLKPDSLVSMNLWGFNEDIIYECKERFFAFLEEKIQKDIEKAEFYLPSVVSDLIAEGRARVKLIPTDEKWYGVTYKEDKSEVSLALEKMVKNEIYPINL